MKICYVASSGGHWEELLCLKELFGKYESLYVIEEGGQAKECQLHPLYTVPQINRKEKAFWIHFWKLIITENSILCREMPDFIITTGALISVPLCVIGKLRGVKVIFIESFARVNKPSLSGRICYPFADLFLIQWKELKNVYPKAKYIGGIF